MGTYKSHLSAFMLFIFRLSVIRLYFHQLIISILDDTGSNVAKPITCIFEETQGQSFFTLLESIFHPTLSSFFPSETGHLYNAGLVNNELYSEHLKPCSSKWNKSLQNFFSSVIWQKGESQNGCNKNTKHAKFSEKRTFFYPLILTLTFAYPRDKKRSFFGIFGELCIPVISVLRFAHLSYYRRFQY